MLGHPLHLGLELLGSDRPLPVIFQRLRVAQIIFDFLFNLRLDIIASSDGLGSGLSFGQIR